jgi:hypothetical protein
MMQGVIFYDSVTEVLDQKRRRINLKYNKGVDGFGCFRPERWQNLKCDNSVGDFGSFRPEMCQTI